MDKEWKVVGTSEGVSARAQTRAPGIPSLLILGATSSRFFRELSVPPPLRVSCVVPLSPIPPVLR